MSLALSYRYTKDLMEHFSHFHHHPSLSQHLLQPGLCQSILKDHPDSTPSPAFLHRVTGIIGSKFKLDHLIHLLRPFQHHLITLRTKVQVLGFPGGSVVKNLPANEGDMGSMPDVGRSHMPRSN